VPILFLGQQPQLSDRGEVTYFACTAERCVLATTVQGVLLAIGDTVDGETIDEIEAPATNNAGQVAVRVSVPREGVPSGPGKYRDEILLLTPAVPRHEGKDMKERR
jgi:hypothetical protein